MVKVHHFKVWDINTGDWRIPPLKSTAARIAKVRGKIIPGSMENVPASSLDREGRWDSEKPRKASAESRLDEAALRRKLTTNEKLDAALDKSFPASDPVSLGHSDHVGQPKSARDKASKLSKGSAGLKGKK